MTSDERRTLLRSIRKGDTITVQHGSGTMSAHVISTVPKLIVRKITKDGHLQNPVQFSALDVLARVTT
jgi:hypothetical protein